MPRPADHLRPATTPACAVLRADWCAAGRSVACRFPEHADRERRVTEPRISACTSMLAGWVSPSSAGSGPAVVLAHGFVGDARSTWGSQIDWLSDDFTVIAWDAPGAGGSSDPPEDFGMDAYADCLAGFLRALRIERAHLAGLSFGGALVLAAFHRHRGLATSLTLVSGYAGWVGSLGTEEADQRLARSLEASRLTPTSSSPRWHRRCSRRRPESSSWRRSSTVCAPSDPSGFRAMTLASYPDQRHVLAEVDVPMLLLYADHDVRAPVSIGQSIHDAVPGWGAVRTHRTRPRQHGGGPGRGHPPTAPLPALD